VALLKVIASQLRQRADGARAAHWMNDLDCGHRVSAPVAGPYKDHPPKRQHCWECKREAANEPA
jgi:hypothetical protein